MAKKISKQEFENCADQFSQFFNNYVDEIEKENERKAIKKLAALIISYIRNGNPLFLNQAVHLSHNICRDSSDYVKNKYANEPIAKLDNLTFQQWLEKIKKKLEEHYIAKGKYNPHQRSSLASLKQKIDWYYENCTKDEDKFATISPYLDQESYKDFSEKMKYRKEVKKIIKEYNIPEPDDEKDDEEMKADHFIIDDLYASFQEAERKKAERERVICQQKTKIQPILPNLPLLGLTKIIIIL